ncbi:MAG: DUF938 domain-containing protein [Kordiimonas sp.]
MAHFFNPDGKDGKADLRLHAPATARNRDVIFDVLAPTLPENGLIFEVASGTGEHAVHMAPKLPNHVWQPTDIEDHHLKSIDAWREEVSHAAILPARHFNVLDNNFLNGTSEPLAAILAINLIHISPWAVTEALVAKAGEALKAGNILFLYGPYKQGGKHTSESNAQFDLSLKSRDPSWGVKDMEAVLELTNTAGFEAPKVTSMPANNFSLVFKKQT